MEKNIYFINKIKKFKTLKNIIIVKVSYETNDISLDIRDDNDKPVLRATLEAKADILITGDKDFLESNILNPIIVKTSDFYYNY